MLIVLIVGWNLRAQKKYYHIFYLNWAVGTTVIQLGQICACILAVYQISNGAPIGNFIMLVSYWGNFTGNCPDVVAEVDQAI